MLTSKEIYELFKQQCPPAFVALADDVKVSTDTRDLGENSVFVALKGEKFDGHHFIDKALEAGALFAVAEHIPTGIAAERICLVQDTTQAYQEIATYYRSKFDIPVVAVTGSNGKTSTKDMIFDCLKGSMKVLKNHANFNNEIGVPKTLLGLNLEHQAAVVEMGMRGLGQIATLTEIAKPTMAVITTVNATHIELLGSIENIAIAKAEIFKDFTQDNIVVLNYDNVYVKTMNPLCPKVYFGLTESADVYATEIKYSDCCTSFKCVDKLRKESYMVSIPLVGEHNLYNALAALTVASLLKVNVEEALHGLAETQLSAMRQTVEKYSKNITVINDAYNAGPVSMQMALDTLKTMAPHSRKIAVLGDMLELGEISRAAHENLARDCVRASVDIVFLYGECTKFTAQEAVKIGLNAVHFEDKLQLSAYLKKIIKHNDVLLFKGSRGMGMEEVITNVFNKKNESGV